MLLLRWLLPVVDVIALQPYEASLLVIEIARWSLLLPRLDSFVLFQLPVELFEMIVVLRRWVFDVCFGVGVAVLL